MSKYTTEVRFICETLAGLDESAGLTSVKEVINKSRGKIFDFEYPIFDNNYKSVLETKILKHFYTREIGAETVGLWKLWLETRLNEIMPYYNKLYKSELIEFNPMYDVDLTTDHVKKTKGSENYTEENRTESDVHDSTTRTGGDKIDRWEYSSDTPSGDNNGVVDLKYLTNVRHITDDGYQTKEDRLRTGTVVDDGTKEGDRDMTSNEDYLQHVKGKTAGISFSKMLEEYRQTFMNIDMMIINDLNDLFMNLW